MARVDLRIYQNPGQAEAFIRLPRREGGFLTHTGIVDTGAQAGIAGQEFKAVEALARIVIEDLHGNQSPQLESLVWFTKTRRVLIGFGGILERAVFHLNMPRLVGYLDFSEEGS